MEQLLLVNPAKRKKGKRKSAKRAAAAAPAKRRKRSKSRALRFYRNPAPRRRAGLVAGLGDQVIAGAMGAAGGLAVDVALKFAPLNLKTGLMAHLMRGVGAVALGMVGNMVKLPMAGQMAQGAMTVALYGAARELVTVPMGLSEYTESDMAGLAAAADPELLDYQPAETIGAYETVYEGMGEYYEEEV